MEVATLLHWVGVYETLEDSVQHVITVGPHYQSHHLPPLNQIEANTSYCMWLPFQIRPCETKAKSMHLVNSFMYHDELITEAYEGASWAFPTETYDNTILTWVHFQGSKFSSECISLLMLLIMLL